MLPTRELQILGRERLRVRDFLIDFRSEIKAQVTAIRITEQLTLLIMSKINRPGYKSSLSIFAKNGQSNLVLVLVLESKALYYLEGDRAMEFP